MIRIVGPTAVLVTLLVGTLQAQDDIRHGTLKKVDADKGTVTITVGGQDREFRVTAGTRVMGADGQFATEPFAAKGLAAGAAVDFKARETDGKAVLIGLRLQPQRAGRAAPPPFDTSKLKPLTELGRETYQGHAGGLYPNGRNEPPASHAAAGRRLAAQVHPLDAAGQPAKDGKIVLLSVGMSNTTQEFSTFQTIANADRAKNPQLVLVDGAQGGMTAKRIRNAEDNADGARFWATVDQRLKAAGATREQVQAAWLKEADAGPTQSFPEYARTLQAELRQIVQLLHRRFPNLKLVYLSGRIYGGYAKTPLNPEPYAYESNLAVKWLIEEQLNGDPALSFDPANGEVKAPWLAWGPYLWANTTKRADGLSYEEGDFGPDGTHPSAAGRKKVAEQLLKFFKEDPTAKPWFVRAGG
jgi:hypothetical protein